MSLVDTDRDVVLLWVETEYPEKTHLSAGAIMGILYECTFDAPRPQQSLLVVPVSFRAEQEGHLHVVTDKCTVL